MSLPSNITLNTGSLSSMNISPGVPVALFDAAGNVSIDGKQVPVINADHTVNFPNGPTQGPFTGWIALSTFRTALLTTVYTLSGPAVFPVGG